MADGGEEAGGHRDRAVAAAAELMSAGGPGAVTIRAVGRAAGVQAPAIYRWFGDKDGLLAAVAEHTMATWVSEKRAAGDGDPVQELRAGWDSSVGFGLTNPGVFTLLTTAGGAASPAAAAGAAVLRAKIDRVAAAGRLRVAPERAAGMLHAAGIGTVLSLLTVPDDGRRGAFAAAMREAVLRAVVTDVPGAPAGDDIAAAVAFATVVPRLSPLSGEERGLLAQWLDRVAAGPTGT